MTMNNDEIIESAKMACRIQNLSDRLRNRYRWYNVEKKEYFFNLLERKYEKFGFFTFFENGYCTEVFKRLATSYHIATLRGDFDKVAFNLIFGKNILS